MFEIIAIGQSQVGIAPCLESSLVESRQHEP